MRKTSETLTLIKNRAPGGGAHLLGHRRSPAHGVEPGAAARHCASTHGAPAATQNKGHRPQPPRRPRIHPQTSARASEAAVAVPPSSLAPANAGVAATRASEEGEEKNDFTVWGDPAPVAVLIRPKPPSSRRIKIRRSVALGERWAGFGPRGHSRRAVPGRFCGPVVGCWAKGPGMRGAHGA